MMGQSETPSRSEIIFFTLLSNGAQSSNFTVQDHIPGTAGDALTMHES
jgi:hypothetical protein